MSEQTAAALPVGARARRRVMRRVIPYLFLLYVVAFLDRVNVGYAALEMTKDLGFSAAVYGFGAGIFFIGYFLLEIPGTLIVETWSARGWIARIMVTWGLLAVLMGFIKTEGQFYGARFLLGAAEAGFFPGIIVYLRHWFIYEDRAKSVALFMAAIPLVNVLGAPLSGLLLGVNWLGLAGWRWLFILEGAPAIVLGVATIFYLTDRPHQARWLPADERQWLIDQLAQEKQYLQGAHSQDIWKALRHREVVLSALAYFFIVTSTYGLNFWLPTLVKKFSGLPNLMVTFIVAIPYAVALLAMLAVGWSSDRRGERRWHTVGSMVVASLGLLLSALAQDHLGLALAMFCIAAAGLSSYLPCFWALTTNFLVGSAAAAAIGLINSVGNLGGFVGPYLIGYLNTVTGSFFGGVLYLSCSALVAALLILRLRQAGSHRTTSGGEDG